MAGNNQEAVLASHLISRQEKARDWNFDAFLTLDPEEGGDVTGAVAEAYRQAVTLANLVVMPLDELSVHTWQQANDQDRTARLLRFARFLRERYPCATVLVFFVVNNLAVARAVWTPQEPEPRLTLFPEPRPMEEIAPELLERLG
jgi:hypothetical protein